MGNSKDGTDVGEGGRGYLPVRGGKGDGFVVPVLLMVGPGERQVYYFIV